MRMRIHSRHLMNQDQGENLKISPFALSWPWPSRSAAFSEFVRSFVRSSVTILPSIQNVLCHQLVPRYNFRENIDISILPAVDRSYRYDETSIFVLSLFENKGFSRNFN